MTCFGHLIDPCKLALRVLHAVATPVNWPALALPLALSMLMRRGRR